MTQNPEAPKKRGWIGRNYHRLMGKKDRTVTLTGWEKIGLKFDIDSKMAQLMDLRESMDEDLRKERDHLKFAAQLLYYVNKFIIFGHPADNEPFRRDYVAFRQLCANFQQGINSGGIVGRHLRDALIHLYLRADIVISYCLSSKYVSPSTPILAVFPGQDNRFRGFGDAGGGDGETGAGDRY